MRPTARVRNNRVLRTTAKLCRQYLKWFGNASYKAERNGERWLIDTLRSESIRTVLDVGANVGSWSLMASEFFPSASIYAFEIVPDTAVVLQRNTAPQPRIKAFALGMAAHTGTLAINYHPSASAHATFTLYPHRQRGTPVECPVIGGSDFLAREGLREVDFLKLDVEGAEHFVLQGLEEEIGQKRIRFIQFEYGRVNILTHFLLKDFYDFFAKYGYVVGKLYPDHIDFREYDLGDEDFIGPNYLACRADDPALGRLKG